MRFTIAFSPCPNDTFILHALLHGLIDTHGIAFEPVIDDVEALNLMAIRGEVDITKLSFNAWLKVRDDYALLDSGAALGFGCGPLVIGKTPLSDLKHSTVALPGENTTAHLLFSLAFPGVTDKRFIVFSEIEDAVLNGDVDAGVIIHENRFTYQDKGLVKILDLGEWWEETTGCPIPLGAYAMHKRVDPAVRGEVEKLIANSVRHAFRYPADSREFVAAHAQEMDREVMQRHIETYVNDFSISLGTEGRKAVDELERRAAAVGAQ